MNYQPNLFRAIALQLIVGEPEQYLYASSSGLTAMFSSPEVAEAINAALASQMDPVSVIRAEYQLLAGAHNYVFADGVTGLIDVNGVVVELSVRQLSDTSWRVLFSRVDAAKLYTNQAELIRDLSERVSALERCAEHK